ncbi:hypothetical protein GPALN_014130 [Globodera pallida]|nr:hypothetical protein GPALN_014130 [Globodera pallida]
MSNPPEFLTFTAMLNDSNCEEMVNQLKQLANYAAEHDCYSMADKLPPREFYESEEQYARAYSAWEDDQRAARRAAEAQRVGRMRRCMSSAKFSDDSQFFSVLTGKEFHQKNFNLETILKLHKRVLNDTNPEEAGKLRKRAHRKARYELDLGSPCVEGNRTPRGLPHRILPVHEDWRVGPVYRENYFFDFLRR